MQELWSYQEMNRSVSHRVRACSVADLRLDCIASCNSTLAALAKGAYCKSLGDDAIPNEALALAPAELCRLFTPFEIGTRRGRSRSYLEF